MASTGQSTSEVLPSTNEKLYVLKKILLRDVKPKHQLAAIKEAQIMATLDHPNIIKYYTSFVEEDHLHIVMEYAPRGDLY